MYRCKRWIAVLLCLSLAAGLLAGCTEDPNPVQTGPSGSGQTEAPSQALPSTEVSTVPATTIPVTTEPPPPDYAALYLEALAQADACETLSLTTVITTDVTCGSETLTESQTEIAKFQNRGTEDLILLTTRTVRQKAHSFNLSQLYTGGRLYSTYLDSKFCADETEENFLSQQTPLAMIDPGNYGSVTAEGETIRFSEASGAEAWAMPAGGKLTEASASATLKDGKLTDQTYELSYTYAGTPIHAVYSSHLRLDPELDLAKQLPADESGYVEVQSSEFLMIFLRSRFAMSFVTSISMDMNFTAFSQAANVIYRDQSETHLCGSGKDLLLSTDYSISLTDLNGKEKDSYSMKETLINGLYTLQEDGGEEETETIPDAHLPTVTQQLLDNIVGGLAAYTPDISMVTGATVYDLGDYLLVEYQCGEEYAKLCDRVLCRALFQNETLLMDHATSFAPETAEGYLAVEKYTWLPTALGSSYRGTHVIEGQPMASGSTTNYSLSLYDPDTPKEITGNPVPDTEPEELPDPVFYEVRGENGETLYLFGTIHVGDDRTAFLPQHIYDAFDSADALAVEFDINSFEEQLESDEELQQRAAAAYYYLDGSKTKEHIEDAELYENAIRFMKTIGQYGTYTDLLKPFVWSNGIENFYLSQGRHLTSSKGVDNRLLARAEESGKEILDVESGIAQLEMMSGYSEALQELLLEEAMGLDRCTYLDQLEELFDAWCEGDEAALIQELNEEDDEDLEEMTEEEKALYEEYITAMETDRNANMKEIAIGYLNSGKTVFFAVGLAHLLREGGLVQTLREEGYTVTLIQSKNAN